MNLARCAAPRLGLEPRTYRLTAGRSTIELSGNIPAGFYHRADSEGATDRRPGIPRAECGLIKPHLSFGRTPEIGQPRIRCPLHANRLQPCRLGSSESLPEESIPGCCWAPLV